MCTDSPALPIAFGDRRCALLFLAVILTAATPVSAADSASIASLHVGFDSSGGSLKLGAWMPVRVAVAAGDAGFLGSVEISVPDNQGIPSLVHAPVRLAAGQSLTTESHVRAGIPIATVTAQLRDERGSAVGRPVTLTPATQWGRTSKLVLHAGSPPGLVDVGKLPKFRSLREEDRLLEFAKLAEWPHDALGLDAAAVIVIPAGDPEVVEGLRQGGAKVLRSWVERGGHAVISLGPDAGPVRELLGDMLPATIDGTMELPDVGAVETFAGSVSPPLRGTVNVVRMQADTSRVAEVLAATPQTHLVVRGAYGLGRVTLTGLNVQAQPVSDWTNRALVWDKLLDLRGQTRDLVGEISDTRGALIQSATTELAGQIHQALETYPKVTLVPFGWVAFFIFGYLLLIGPVEYLFLRKLVRRMELTWVTFPLIVVATTLAAYWAAAALKGTTPRINKLDLLDVDQTGGQVRGTSWWTVYSTGNRDFGIELVPQPSTLWGNAQWSLDGQRTCSWFSPEEPALVGVGRVALVTRPSVYGPPGRVERIDDMRIPIWSTRSFTGRWDGKAPGVRLVDSELHMMAGDRAAGSVRNLMDTSLRNAQLFYGKNVYELGTIRPRGVGRVDYSRAEAVARLLGRLVQKARRWQQEAEHRDEGEAADARADLLRGALFHDAMGTRAESYPSHALAALDMTGQMSDLRRPMLVAEVDLPAATLRLSGDPAEPIVAQTTVVRIILDMDQGETPNP